MKKQTVKGVTLLEIMLVLAIASMVIVMSIRYYQQANNSQNVNVLMNQIQNITAAADNLAQNAGGYSGINAATFSTVAGSNNLRSPYGTAMTIAFTATTVTITPGAMPASVCAQLTSKLTANPKYTVTGGSACTTIVYTSSS